jgi:hypothetical protein
VSGEPLPGTQEFAVTNEFADVRIRKVYTRNGERLRIESPKRGYAVELDAIELESLTWQTKEAFSRLLESSTGPGDLDGAR